MSDDAIDALLFDLDGTLCEYRRTSGELLEIAHDRVGVDQFIDQREYVETYGKLADESEDMLDLREKSFVTIAERKGRDPDLAREMAAEFAAERDHRNVDPIPGAREVVEHFRDRYPVGLITNGAPEMQAQKMAALDIVDAFDVEVYAGYEGVASKPSPEPFEVALDDLGVSPDRAAYVGNSVESDVAGARAANLRSVLLSDRANGHDPTPDHVIGSLDELRALDW